MENVIFYCLNHINNNKILNNNILINIHNIQNNMCTNTYVYKFTELLLYLNMCTVNNSAMGISVQVLSLQWRFHFHHCLGEKLLNNTVVLFVIYLLFLSAYTQSTFPPTYRNFFLQPSSIIIILRLLLLAMLPDVWYLVMLHLLFPES